MITQGVHMTDLFNNPFGLSVEMIAEIGSYLNAQELHNFKSVCQKFNLIGAHISFLQPLYNRLRALDAGLPAILNPQQFALEFKRAVKKIKEEQKIEIKKLHDSHPNDYRNEIDALLATDATTIKQLEEINEQLNNLNRKIIDDFISCGNYTSRSSSGKLVLRLNFSEKLGVIQSEEKGLVTRFLMSSHHAQNLEELYLSNSILKSICLKNYPCIKKVSLWQNLSLQSISLDKLNALESFICRYNRLLTTISVKNCDNLDQVVLSNSIVMSHVEFSDCLKLKHFSFLRSRFKTMDLHNCPVLENMDFCDTTFPMLTLRNFVNLQNLKLNKNTELTNLNLQGCTQLQHLEFCEKLLVDLCIEGTPAAIQKQYGELEEKLLFRQLSQKDLVTEQQSTLKKRLGHRFTPENCLKYGISFKAEQPIDTDPHAPFYSQVMTTMWNTVSSYMPTFSGENKRKREDNDEEDKHNKKIKLNLPSNP